MKVEFTGPLWVVDWEDQGAWVLLQDLTATATEDDGTVIELVVPAAFITDFCSVPRLPFVYDLFGNVARKAGALHDWLYAKAEHPREWCDQVLRAAIFAQVFSTLISQDIPEEEARQSAEATAGAMYLAVRTFGGPHYGKALKTR